MLDQEKLSKGFFQISNCYFQTNFGTNLVTQKWKPKTKIGDNKNTLQGISKLSGQAKASTYPQVGSKVSVEFRRSAHFPTLQPEGTLGEAMSTYGNKLQDFDSESIFAHSLVEGGEALKQMADLKYALDDNVKQVNRLFCHEYILVIFY